MTQYYDTHFEAFLAFAKLQPVDREINHSGGWCSCAVGNYHDEATSEPPRGYEDETNLTPGFAESPLLTELEKDHRLIYECLNSGHVIDELVCSGEGYEIQTYAGLAEFMETFKFVEVELDEDGDVIWV